MNFGSIQESIRPRSESGWQLLETINSHAVRIEKLLVSLCRQDDAGPEKAMADKEGPEVDESHSRVPPTR